MSGEPLSSTPFTRRAVVDEDVDERDLHARRVRVHARDEHVHRRRVDRRTCARARPARRPASSRRRATSTAFFGVFWRQPSWPFAAM